MALSIHVGSQLGSEALNAFIGTFHFDLNRSPG
jgi:hypothetical protein